MDMSKDDAGRIGGAIFLIGLGVIAFLNYWWPGIMFVIAASLIATEWTETGGQISTSSGRVIGAIVMVVIGLVGMVGIDWGALWPIMLIGIGVLMLVGKDKLPGKRGE